MFEHSVLLLVSLDEKGLMMMTFVLLLVYYEDMGLQCYYSWFLISYDCMKKRLTSVCMYCYFMGFIKTKEKETLVTIIDTVVGL